MTNQHSSQDSGTTLQSITPERGSLLIVEKLDFLDFGLKCYTNLSFNKDVGLTLLNPCVGKDLIHSILPMNANENWFFVQTHQNIEEIFMELEHELATEKNEKDLAYIFPKVGEAIAKVFVVFN